MAARELHNLQEAYMSVYQGQELDEGSVQNMALKTNNPKYVPTKTSYPEFTPAKKSSRDYWNKL